MRTPALALLTPQKYPTDLLLLCCTVYGRKTCHGDGVHPSVIPSRSTARSMCRWPTSTEPGRSLTNRYETAGIILFPKARPASASRQGENRKARKAAKAQERRLPVHSGIVIFSPPQMPSILWNPKSGKQQGFIDGRRRSRGSKSIRTSTAAHDCQMAALVAALTLAVLVYCITPDASRQNVWIHCCKLTLEGDRCSGSILPNEAPRLLPSPFRLTPRPGHFFFLPVHLLSIIDY